MFNVEYRIESQSFSYIFYIFTLIPGCWFSVIVSFQASLKILSEIALAEVVVRSIRAVGEMPDSTFEGRELLLEDLYELLNKVAIKALSSQHSMQVGEHFNHL